MTEQPALSLVPRRTPGAVTFGSLGATTSVINWSASELTASRAWAALTQVFAAEAADPHHGYAKLLVNGEYVRESQCWPTTRADGKRPSSWIARQENFSHCDDVFVYARSVQEHDRELFRTIVELLAPHVHHLGVPPGHVEVEVFFGAYRNTPGGIHREGCTNLHLVLSGRKSMYFWEGTDWVPEGTPVREDIEAEDEAPEEYMPTLDRRSMQEYGHFLTASTGGGFFWRSGIWHVGETHEATVALNIASYTGNLKVEAELLVPWRQRLHGLVPAPWLADYRAHISFQGDDAALLARLTALGMRPARPEGLFDMPISVRCISTAPVLWVEAASGRLIVAALGHAADFADNPAVRNWLEASLCDFSVVNDVPRECGQLAQWLCAQQILEPMEA